MLSTTLDLDANPFVHAFQAVNETVEKFSSKITAVSSLFSGLRDASEMVVGVFEKFTSVVELGAHLTDLSRATGEAQGELLVLERAFINAGKGADAVIPFFSRLDKAIGGINEEGHNTAAAFKALGTSAEELRGLSVTDQVERLSRGFTSMTDRADRGQVALDLFGKSGEEMLAVFRDPEAISTARTQVGSLATTIEKISPLLKNMADAFGAIGLKLQQFAAGFILAAGFTDFSDALNRIDLGSLGEKLGTVAHAVLVVAGALKPLVPVVLSLGAGWLATMVSTQIASIGIVTAVRSVVAATVGGVRAIMASLGPYGLAIAALTYVWLKYRDAVAKQQETRGPKAPGETALSAPSDSAGGLAVSSMTARGLSAFTGVAGLVTTENPVVSRVDRSNALLETIAKNTAPRHLGEAHSKRPDVPV